MPVTLARPSRRLMLITVLLGVVAGLLTAAPAKAAPVPAGWTYQDAWFTAHDGTQLHAGVFLPADRDEGEQHPVLMNIGPYTAPNGGATSPGNVTGIVDRNPEIWAHLASGRWAYVAVDARGFGGSEGCFGYYMEHEMLDAKTSIEWAAQQPWSTGKVGMWGKSYDGAEQVLAMANEETPQGLAATVIQAPGLSGYTALWHNGVHYATGRYGTTGIYTAEDLLIPQNLDTIDSPEYARAAAAPVTSIPNQPTCRSDAALMNAIGDRNDPYWADKEPYKGAAGSDVPTFWQHGFFDANTKATHLDIWDSLTGPKKAWFGQWDHKRGHESVVGRHEFFLDEAFRFLDEHVRGIASPTDEHHVTVQSGNADQLWRNEAQWPPADAATWTMPVNAGSYADKPGNNPTSNTGLKDGFWTISPELPHAAHLAGEAIANLQISSQAPWTHTVAHLYDIDDSGRASLVTRGAIATPKSGAEEIALELYPQDWVFERGHRIALHLSASDDNWYSPGVSQTTVTVTGGGLDLPLLRYVRGEFIEGSPSLNQGGTNVTEATITGAEVETEMPPAQQPRPEPEPAEQP